MFVQTNCFFIKFIKIHTFLYFENIVYRVCFDKRIFFSPVYKLFKIKFIFSSKWDDDCGIGHPMYSVLQM